MPSTPLTRRGHRLSEFITRHCPPAANGQPLIDADALRRMRPGAVVINTARHDLIDADAALNALQSEQLGGFAPDVFDTEPPPTATSSISRA